MDGCRGGSRPPGGDQPSLSIQFSPNAEPLSGGLLGRPKCEDALSGWFDRTDINHDGVIDHDEFLADARRQFDRMDIHHAGYVTALDLSEFRAPYEAAPTDEGVPPDAAGQRGGQAGGSGERRGPGGRSDSGRGPQQRGPSVDTRADPVMSADKTLSFKVTLQDFLNQAEENFRGLDHNHDGRITRETVTGSCKASEKK
ncbi:hypothetical protein CWS72_07290 [Telmatospirillum siberiense]|uniref:EF-hand domain-containing protein n=1 Tax=Telmatospirillum siberiense TaxID=382514 RepID=A0A2N3PY94_9PROT|nr:hypothetical protein CWS72_07290 [Telmatospirillum siberiense]